MAIEDNFGGEATYGAGDGCHDDPEEVNHDNPPAHRIKEVFLSGNRGRAYVKPRDAGRILRDNDLMVAVRQGGELRSLVNTILTLCGQERIS